MKDLHKDRLSLKAYYDKLYSRDLNMWLNNPIHYCYNSRYFMLKNRHINFDSQYSMENWW